MHIAAERGEINAIRFLVEAGADIHTKDEDGRTPLHIAESCGKIGASRFLVKIGSNVHEEGKL